MTLKLPQWDIRRNMYAKGNGPDYMCHPLVSFHGGMGGGFGYDQRGSGTRYHNGNGMLSGYDYDLPWMNDRGYPEHIFVRFLSTPDGVSRSSP